ncbi:hypothetical protein Tco_1105450 [Tanacetum coccineum]
MFVEAATDLREMKSGVALFWKAPKAYDSHRDKLLRRVDAETEHSWVAKKRSLGCLPFDVNLYRRWQGTTTSEGEIGGGPMLRETQKMLQSGKVQVTDAVVESRGARHLILQMIGLPSDAVEKLLEGEDISKFKEEMRKILIERDADFNMAPHDVSIASPTFGKECIASNEPSKWLHMNLRRSDN